MKSIGAIASLFTLPSKETWNIEKGLNWAYNQTLQTDMPCGLCNALELADEYRMNFSSITEASDKLIKDQLLTIGGVGFLASLGTSFTSSLKDVPESLGISWVIQLRMVNALACLGGHDLESEKVRSLTFILLLGEQAKTLLQQKIVEDGMKAVIKNIVPQFECKISRFGNILPVISGIVGASLDVLMSYSIAKTAQKTFLGIAMEQENFTQMEEERIKLLINMGTIDGDFCAREKELICKIIKDSSCSESKKETFYNALESNTAKPYRIDYNPFKKEKYYGINLMVSLISVAQADGFIHPAEKIYLEEIAKELHISIDEFSSIIETCQVKKD